MALNEGTAAAWIPDRAAELYLNHLVDGPGEYEPAIRAMEQGRPFSLDDLSPATRTAPGILKDKLDTQPRDWARYTRQAAEFHRRNARAWASAAAGEDLAGQIDPEFTLGPNALAMAQA